MGGVVTVVWDVWLAQKVGKIKAKWESKRRRARNEAGDAEDTSATQDIQLVQELEIRQPEAVKRRVYAGTSTERIISGGGESDLSRADSQRNTEPDTMTNPEPVADVKAHNISIRLSVSLIAGFFGK